MGQINPRIDVVFKKIFGVNENKDLLISLINAVVQEDDRVTDVDLLNPYHQQNIKNGRLPVLEIKARGSSGKRLSIEIQIADERDCDKQALYDWSRIYTNQFKAAEDDFHMNKVIGIHFFNGVCLPEAETYHNTFCITRKGEGPSCFKDFELHTIELKKFTDGLGRSFEGLQDQIHNALDLWSTFLTRYDLLIAENLNHRFGAPELKKALNVLNTMNFSDEEKQAYEDCLNMVLRSP